MTKRTNPQNASIRVFDKLLADELNAKGYTVKLVLDKMKTGAEVPWTPSSTHELLWKVMQKALTGKESSTELDTVQPSDIHQTLMHWINENLPEVDYIDFPNRRG
jgi:hypothetical protein